MLDESQELLRVTGQEIGADGKVDVRVWRQDIDEGWETTAVNSWTEESGDANALRTFSAALQSVCAPVRIHSVKEGADKTESVPVDDKERLAIIRPRGAAGTTETVGGDTEAADGGPEAA